MNNTFETFWHYHSEAPKSRRVGAANSPPPAGIVPLSIAAENTDFQISLDTGTYRPNHIMTLRTDVDGWGRDIHGSYWHGAWRYVLPKAEYKSGCKFRFLLDGTIWQLGGPQVIASPVNTHLGEADVKFPQLPAEEQQRFQHSYENLRVAEDQEHQNLIRTNYSEAEEWDVIVIGSGMGGGTLADALSDFPTKKLKVLVLDAGSLDYATHIYNLPVTGLHRLEGGHQVRHYDVPDEDSFGQYVHMNLGGRSVFWSGLIPRMRDWELAHWPEAIRDYLKNCGYEQAEKLMRKHVAAGSFQEGIIERLKTQLVGWTVVNTPRSSHQPEFGPEGSPENNPPSFLFQSTGTFSTAELLLDSMNSGGDPGRGLHVNLNHLVTRLEHEGDRVTEVVCQDLVGNRERRYRGKFVVLAAGSLESVKIALQSKLKDRYQKIGIGFTDHPSYYAPDSGGETFFVRDGSSLAGPDKHARIFLYPDEPWEGHWFNVEIVLNGQYWRSRHADDEVLKAEHPADARTTVRFKFVFSSPIQEDNFVRLKAPNERLQVHHAKNPTGEDARPAVLNLLKKLLAFFEVVPVDLSKEANCHFGNGGTPAHAGATLRMGLEGQPRVVDENLKFDGYENLYVCDPSVYPFIPAANPSLTLAALALRLAGHLASKV